jgi:hypothetical protein
MGGAAMKVLKTAAIVIGAVALVATGIGAIAVPGFLGMSAATLATVQTIGTVATLASSAISLGAALFAPRPGFGGGGSPLDFQTNPQSGLPYAIGRTRMSGLKIAGATASSPGWTASHDLLFFAVLLSCAGPIHAIESFAADNVTISFDGGTGAATTGGHAGWMAQKVSPGATPQPAALSLSLNGGAFPGWTASHKLSGLAHALWALRHDSDGGHYSGGVPEPAWVARWVKVYDPRMDSSYPGGAGSQRANDEATWTWSRNPALHALAWAIGRHTNGKLVCGIGAPIANIRVADFVEAANVADANGWGCGGVEWTTEPKWDVFKRMLQAGGAVPVKTGAMIGCRVRTPRVSLGTIESGDFLGELVWPSSKPRRERFNSALPRYVSESHGWEVITGSEVSVPGWVTEDGGKRTKGIDLPLVQAEVGQAGYDGADQAGQLATYEIADSRETGPIEFATGPKWIGLRCGDCVVLNRPEDDIVSQKVVITGRTIDPANGLLRFTAETETDSKHAFALGETSSPPPAPTLSVPAGRPAVPGGSAWSVSAVALADGQPGLRIAGAIDDLIADRALVNYRQNGTSDWIVAPDIAGTGDRTLDLGPLDGEAGWDVRIAYGAGVQTGDWLEFTDVPTGASAIIAAIAGKVRQGTALPLAADCAEGDLFILTNWGNRAFVRVAGDGLLRNNGDLVLNNGESIGVSVWQEVTDARVAQAIADAAAAQASADAAQARVDAVTSDDVITAGAEKRQIVSDVTWMLNEHAALDAKALAIGAASGERSAAAAAIAALNAYLAGLSPAWDDAAHDTGLDGATLAGLFADATDKVTLLQAAIQGMAGIVTETTGPAAFAVACTADYVPKSGALTGASGTMRLRNAMTGPITAGVSDFIVAATENCGASIDGVTGEYDFTAITANQAIAVFRCTYEGVDYQLVVSLNKVRDGQSAAQQNDSATISALSATTYPVADSEHVDIDIAVPDGATLTVHGQFDYAPDAVGSFTGKIKVSYQNISDSGPETDLASATGSGSTRSFIFTDEWGNGYFVASPGQVVIDDSSIVNSSGSAKNYRLRIYAAKDSGSQAGGGTVSIAGSTAWP